MDLTPSRAPASATVMLRRSLRRRRQRARAVAAAAGRLASGLRVLPAGFSGPALAA